MWVTDNVGLPVSHVATVLIGLVLLPSVLQGNGTGTVPALYVTLILYMGTDVPNEVVSAMKTEFVRIYVATPYQFQWRSSETVQEGESFDNLTVVRVTGTCAADPSPLYDERGPLGLTHVTDGDVLPFVSLDCDRLRTALRSDLYGRDAPAWRLMFGRALGRVLAHEMYHVLAHTEKHGKTGVTKGSLSARELTAPDLQMDAESLRLIEVTGLSGSGSQASSAGF